MADRPRVHDVIPVMRELEPGEYLYCTCGRTADEPLCDGSHRGTTLRPLVFTVAAKRRAAYCQCKYTREAPYCDGSHRLYEKEK